METLQQDQQYRLMETLQQDEQYRLMETLQQDQQYRLMETLQQDEQYRLMETTARRAIQLMETLQLCFLSLNNENDFKIVFNLINL
jgi:Mg/Co/Ni transporter MgtE